ncbi:putative JmjC domain-containing histone demethylation protein 2C [Papilio xuthus]|uniref:Putative JmjC domain-containing histone demethylation protein 2C n=1 Tax=Papilio xuthus TaxID=66420 RepID=A0A194PME2_PAPXU|nr:putative JmjC domain-containing histone demethylation protein 2C [Papilio xuthus]
MAFRYREDLVGKRFLSVSGVAKINVNKVSEWGWKAGVIRAASLKDNKNKELQTNSTFIWHQVVRQLCLERNRGSCVDRKECTAQYIWPLSLCTRAVLVEYDGVDWQRREWVAVHSRRTFRVFLVERTLVWAPKKYENEEVKWPALTFTPLSAVDVTLQADCQPVEFLHDRSLQFLDYANLQPFQSRLDEVSLSRRRYNSGWVRGEGWWELVGEGEWEVRESRVQRTGYVCRRALVCTDTATCRRGAVERVVQQFYNDWDARLAGSETGVGADLLSSLSAESAEWRSAQDGQRILTSTPSVLGGCRAQVYRVAGATQWYTAVIVGVNEHTGELTVTDDTVLEEHSEDPALVQMRLLGDGVIESIMRGEVVGVMPRRSRSNLQVSVSYFININKSIRTELIIRSILLI